MKHLKKILAAALVISSSVNAYELLGEKWGSNGETVYSGRLSEPYYSAFIQSLNIWNASFGGFPLSGSSISSDPCAGYGAVPEDNRNGVGFASDICGDAFESGVLAVNYSYTVNSVVVDSDIVFNDNELWSIYSGPVRAAADFRRVAVHELGHFLGLGHEESASAIMAPYIGSIEQPTADDVAGVVALYGNGATQPDPDPDPVPTPTQPNIIVSIEEPSLNQIASGVANIRGYAVAKSGIDRVELFIDGNKLSDIPYGSDRQDVSAAYPTYSNSLKSGFSRVYNWNKLASGSHTLIIRAFDNTGASETDTHTFTVQKFDTQFISDSNSVSVGSAAAVGGNTVVLDNVLAAGQYYTVTLRWNTATQQFDPVSVVKK